MDRINALRLFQRLAERRSFSGAARDLRIKQSTASKWVGELESSLGVTLVERTTRSLHLTDDGRRFLSRAAEVLASFDELTRELTERNPEPSGRVRISLPVVYGRLHVLPALSAFFERHPRVEAELVLNDRYVNLVEEGFDLAIRVGIPADTSARGHKLADSRRCLVASPAYLRRHGRPRTPAELVRHQCLVHGESTGVWRFGDRPVNVRARLAANNSEVVLELARRGHGIALLADWLVDGDLRRKRLVELPGFSAPPAPIYALTPPGRHLPVAVRAIIDHLAHQQRRSKTRS